MRWRGQAYCQIFSLVLGLMLAGPVACGDSDGNSGSDVMDLAGDGADDGASDTGDATSDAEDSGQDSDACQPATCQSLSVECGDHDDGCGGTVSCGTCEEGTCNAGVCEGDVQMASSVEQYGITWTFDGEYQVGQFVTGDWWVVGPVTIQSVSPEPTGERNGSMLNPVGAQAYDARGGSYDGEKALAFPLELAGENSLVSSISHPEEGECQQGGSTGWETYTGRCQRGPIRTQAVLTVLSEPPPLSAFRPPYAGTDKPIHLPAGICWDRLPTLPVPEENAPDMERALRHVERPWIDHLNSWTMQHGCATLNMFCYGREIGDVVATVATAVLLDTPEQQDLALRLIQLGIDNFGVLQAGGSWGADGGHFNGRKFPVVFAGGMLGDAAMASPGSFGNEDLMTYYGTNGDALWGRTCTSCYLSAGCAYEGSCENGAKDCRDPDGLVDACADYRNCCTSRTWVGQALAIELMGLTESWDHPAFFDYVERWMNGGVDGGGGANSDFLAALWSQYADSEPLGSACE